MDHLGWGLQITLIGMGTVFGLLLLLMLLLIVIVRVDRPKTASARGGAAARGAGSAPVVSAAGSTVPPGATPTDGVAARFPAAGGPHVRILADGLTDEQIAAITAAVLAHRNLRRHEAAPEMRTFTPGSHLYASRWVAVGRTLQSQPWRRR